MVVDDDFAMLEVLKLLLEGERYSVITASDGEEALALLSHETIHLVLSDYVMPKINGLALFTLMQASETLKHIPFVLMSATYEHLKIPAGVVAVLTKPLRFKELLAVIRSRYS